VSSGVGRNEPCPCGSGRKYKVCCLEHKAKHYSTWSDIALPALDGLTPREAAGDARSRARVMTLLREMDLAERAHSPAGQRFDFGPILRELGIDD
jgi:hypothetical protein